jgi:hypothetical protein
VIQLADIAAKPTPFPMATLGGKELFIRPMTARQVAQWWAWVYERPATRKQYDEQLVELFRRLACDADGAPIVASDADAAKLRETPGAGAILAEFWTEAKRRNFLYQTAEEEAVERDRFFTSRQTATSVPTA